MSEVILAATGKSAIEVTRQFLDAWKTLLDAFDCDGGCAVLAVAVAGPPEQRDLAASIFDTGLSLLEAALSTGGLRKPDAKAFAYLLISAVEGAVVLSRSKRGLARRDRRHPDAPRSAPPGRAGSLAVARGGESGARGRHQLVVGVGRARRCPSRRRGPR